MIFTGQGMVNTGIVMTVSLFFGITGIGMTMMDPGMAMEGVMRTAITKTMAKMTTINRK